jgi:hypothetical protein
VTAIQTRFKGRYYRSRTEARYAALFSFCRLPFDYEKEGFWLELGRYLPDFFLPSLDMWFEVKGALPTCEATNKCHCLADETNQRVVMAYGAPGWETDLGCFSPGWHGNGIQALPAFLMQWISPEIVLLAIEAAQSVRFGEPGNIVPLPLAQRAPEPKLLLTKTSDRGVDLPF